MKINLSDVEIEVIRLGRGLYQYTAWWKGCIYPVGIVWVLGIDKDNAMVMNSYVPKWARRNGIRTLINKEIHKWIKNVLTSEGSKEGGMKFLKASKYKKVPTLGWWIHNENISKKSHTAKHSVSGS